MKENIKIYDSAQNYFEGPEGMKNEVMMWFVAAGLLMQELSKKLGNRPYGSLKEKVGYEENKKLEEVSILDLCSGPGNFVNHLAFVCPNIKVVCVDTNINFIDAGNKVFKKWQFIEGDATKIVLKRKFNFVTASSAYHHIEDGNKVDFMKIIYKHLADDGAAIICEHFLPDYKTDLDRGKSINEYYGRLEQWYNDGNATPKAIQIIREVREQESKGEGEHKVSFGIFRDHVEKSGLKIDTDIPVWQPPSLMLDNAGSHVIILKTK